MASGTQGRLLYSRRGTFSFFSFSYSRAIGRDLSIARSFRKHWQGTTATVPRLVPYAQDHKPVFETGAKAKRMSIFQGVVEVAAFLETQQTLYAVLGGIAVQHWGEPRTTLDIDIVVLVPSAMEDSFLQAVLGQFCPRLPDAFAFAKRNRILLVSTSVGIPVDLSLGIPGYEEEALSRTVPVSFAGLSPVRVVSAEDLIIHKCVAGRPRDIEDVERVLVRQKFKLDLRYIRKWLRAFGPIVEEHDVRKLFESALKKTRKALRKMMQQKSPKINLR